MKIAAVVPALFALISLCGSPVPAPPGSISGVVYFDANRDGIHDSCDSPLANVAVSATAANGKSAQATAGADGVFHIEHAPPGDDLLTLVPGEGFLWPMTTNAGDGRPGLTVHVNELQDTPGVEIGSASQTAFESDHVSISGIIYNDSNANGLIDKNECGFPDAPLAQVQVGHGHATPLRTDGTYQVLNVASPGPVSLTTNPAATGNGAGDLANWTPTTPTLPDSANACGTSVQPVQRYGPNLYEANIGLRQEPNAGFVMGYLFNDTNGNGLRDLNETGVAGASIYLEQQANCAGYSASPYPATDAEGHFNIGGVPQGSYKITLKYQPPPTNGLVASAWDPDMTITVHGQVVTSINLPAHQVQGATVRLSTFDDANGNGNWDGGEQALEGMRVCVLPPGYTGINNVDNPNPNKQSYSNGQTSCGQTGSDGVFLAGPVLAGDYVINLSPLDSGDPFAGNPQQNLTLTEGQQLDLNIPVEIPSPESQVIPGGSGAPLTFDTCYSDPAWVQPPFEQNYGQPMPYGDWPPEDHARDTYSHGIYINGEGLDWSVWATLAGLTDWIKTLPPDCSYGAGGPITTIDLSGYEPVKGVRLGDVEQITLARHDRGLYIVRIVEPEGVLTQSWYLFVDEANHPLARCNSYRGQCEWFN